MATTQDITIIGPPDWLKGPLEGAVRRVFQSWKPKHKVVIVHWNSDWLDNPKRSRLLWRALTKKLKTKCYLLVLLPEAIALGRNRERFRDSPDLLLKSIIADADRANKGKSFGEVSGKVLWADIRNLSWTRSLDSLFVWQPSDDDSRTLRLCKACSGLPQKLVGTIQKGKENGKKGSISKKQLEDCLLNPGHLFSFLHNPTGYQTKELHGARAGSAVNDGALCPEERLWAKKISYLKFLGSRIMLGESPPLNILVVENNPDELRVWHEWVQKSTTHPDFKNGPFSFLKNATWHLIDGKKVDEKGRDFAWLTTKDGRDASRGKHNTGGFPVQNSAYDSEGIPWEKIDLVLQDIMLGGDANHFTGLNLVPHYLQACPQALVFLMTGMDIESLVASSGIDWRHVDAVIPKRRLELLWWEYFRCFQKRFGRMFWNDWVGEPDCGRIGNRYAMRNLFGSLRKWQLEPSILGHGQGVPEMIDHAERHITCLWRNVDDYVSELMENGVVTGEAFSLENRMLLTLGTWLHDIGHRGDEHMQEPMLVRTFHAGISERLLLRNPAAYGLGWLRDFCKAAKCKGGQVCLDSRNDTKAAWDEVCPLRRVGLLCRHHQSNAPLSAASFEKIIQKGKEVSPYSRVCVPDDTTEIHDDLGEWMADRSPLTGWLGSKIVSLEDFVKEPQHSFLQVAGILRMLDGTQLHRHRVGSPACIASFNEFLTIRGEWARKEISRIDHLLTSSVQGTPAYLEAVGARIRMVQYCRLVSVQFIHYWRQIAVHDLEIRLVTDENGNRTIELGFVLDDFGLGQIKEMKPAVLLVNGKEYQLTDISLQDEVSKCHTGILNEKPSLKSQLKELNDETISDESKSLIGYWASHVLDDMVLSEHGSQEFVANETNADKSRKHYYMLPLEGRAGFRVSVLGLSTKRFTKPLIVFETNS